MVLAELSICRALVIRPGQTAGHEAAQEPAFIRSVAAACISVAMSGWNGEYVVCGISMRWGICNCSILN